MSDVLVIDSAERKYIDRNRSLENLCVIHQSVDATLEKNPNTKKITGMRVALEQLGLGSYYRESMESGFRSYLSITAIKTLLVEAVEAIILYIRELIGLGLPLAVYDERIREIHKEIETARLDRTFVYRLPKFANDAQREEWFQRWSRYKEMIGRIDPTVKHLTIERFYLEYRIPQGRAMNVMLCNSVAKGYGVPQCYLNGARGECIRKLFDRFPEIVTAIDSLVNIRISEQTGEVVYDDVGVHSVKTFLSNELQTNWKRKKLGAADMSTQPDWLGEYRGTEVSLLRQYEQQLLSISTKLKRVGKGSTVEFMVSNHISNHPEHAQATRSSINKWLDDVRGVASSVTNIYSNMRRADALTLDTLKSYQRYASKTMEH